jgi:hypothetical protein
MSNVLSKIMGLQKRSSPVVKFEDWNTRIFEAFQELERSIKDLTSTGVQSKHFSRAFNSAAVAIPTGVATAIAFNSTSFQSADIHNNATNPTRMTFQKDGYYSIFASIQWVAAQVGVRRIQIRTNGGIVIASLDHQAAIAPVVAFDQDQIIASGNSFKAGDYIEILGYQNSGAPLNIFRAASYSPEVTVIEH